MAILAKPEKRQGRPEASSPAALPAAGASAASRADRVANRFLLGYLLSSLLWIVGTDWALRFAARWIAIPLWAETVKGLLYVAVFGFALRRAARTYVRTAERNQAIQVDATLDLVRRLALVAEYRDDEMGGHNGRIGRYAAVLGRELGFSQADSTNLGHAAALHDLGKIAIADAVLLKEGPLDALERAEVERHAALGAEILSQGTHPLVVTAHAIALTHHERWDGRGYPQGLLGNEIPLEGRIVAVCDVFDALTSRRPYKDAWPIGEAVDEIVRGRGTHFDPLVVDAFLRCLTELRAAAGTDAPAHA